MWKKFLILITIANLNLTACQTDEKQNLEINVNGKVSDQNNSGVGNVTIYILRGKTGNYAATVYNQFQTVNTNDSGNYFYLVKNDTYTYKICCSIPSGFTSIEETCKVFDHSIINSQTVPNNINFKLIR